MIVYRGRVFAVEVEKGIETVRHSPSVVLIPLPDPQHVVLIKQFRPSIAREMWELPAGGVEPGESADAAAARECEEEIGQVPGRLERLASLFPTPGYCDEEMIFFRATELHAPPPDSPHKPDDDEKIEARTVTVAEAKAMAARGEIADLKTAYALTLI